MKRLAFTALLALSVSACATINNPQLAALSAQIVESALTQPPAQLQQAADSGSANAQFSYSIVKKYGLNGVAVDLDAAAAYRKLALASRGTTNTAIYVPTGKHSGHTQLVSIPRYDISSLAATTVDNCTDALSSRMRPEAVTTQCGDPTTYTRLADLWVKARS